MRKSIISLFITALVLSSCTLEYGTTSKHNSISLQNYTIYKFNSDVLQPTATINILIELDHYICASVEEQQSDAFEWHRSNIFHEDDDSFAVSNIGTVHTFGKSFFDSDSAWDFGQEYERMSENTWKIIGSSYYANTDAYAIITYVGRNEEGKNVYSVEAYDTESCMTGYPEGDNISAECTTPEGPMTIIDPVYFYLHYNNHPDMPLGSGVYRIETDRNGKPLDWMELRYDKSGKNLLFSCNL